MQNTREKRLLQAVTIIACMVPIVAGGVGMITGTAMLDHDPDPAMDSQFRYLSGLLFTIGIVFLSTVPHIEHNTRRFRLLTAMVAVGGLFRLAGAIGATVPPPPMLLAIGMELIVTPALCLWQTRLARQAV